MKQIVFISTLAGLFLACTGCFHQEKKYTPLYLYYNPLDPDVTSTWMTCDYAPEYFYPNFLNYPNDLSKHGLRGNVKDVSYLSRGFSTMVLGFNEKGNIIYTINYIGLAGNFSHIRIFKYNKTGRLEGVYRNPHRDRWAPSSQQFEYDAAGRLLKRKGGMSYAYQTYTYYEDGTLKEITPHITSNPSFKVDTYGKMEFNKSGELIKMEAPTTVNPFFGDAKKSFDGLRSVCTFAYVDGLCTQKHEAIYKETDTLPSFNSREYYIYNAKGEIAEWDYSGVVTNVTPKYYTFQTASFKIRFEYEYDKHDNWTVMRVVLPDNFRNSHFLQEYYYLKTGQQQPFPGEMPIVTIRRQISYHNLPAAEGKGSSPQLTQKPDLSPQLDQQSEVSPQVVQQPEVSPEAVRKPDLSPQGAREIPKYTAVRGHGLSGKVKSVSDKDYTLYFDEYGNIGSKVWKDGGRENYNYQSPLKYRIGPDIGPFRIVCEGNIRKEEDEKGIELSVEYHFDEQGRVILYKYSQGMRPVTEKYTYKGEERFPSTLQKEGRDEEGSYISVSRYTYLEFDQEGNWTRRQVNRTWKFTESFYDGEEEKEKTSTETDPEFMETRTITYY